MWPEEFWGALKHGHWTAVTTGGWRPLPSVVGTEGTAAAGPPQGWGSNESGILPARRCLRG